MAFGVTGQEVLTEIQSRYEKTDDFEASFVQEFIGKGVGKPQKEEGKVYFKKKGMMRWDYRIPSKKLITNGQTLWFYQADENQVFVSDISNVLKEKTPLGFLAGEGDIRRDFNLIHFREPVSPKEDHFVLELAPKERQSTFEKLALTVDKKTYTIIQVEVFDGLGNVTRTRFVDMKMNVNLPGSFFQFTPPPGAEVINMQESSGKKAPKK
jgi:outer membrane lipoprotein carrier protein